MPSERAAEVVSGIQVLLGVAIAILPFATVEDAGLRATLALAGLLVVVFSAFDLGAAFRARPALLTVGAAANVGLGAFVAMYPFLLAGLWPSFEYAWAFTVGAVALGLLVFALGLYDLVFGLVAPSATRRAA